MPDQAESRRLSPVSAGTPGEPDRAPSANPLPHLLLVLSLGAGAFLLSWFLVDEWAREEAWYVSRWFQTLPWALRVLVRQAHWLFYLGYLLLFAAAIRTGNRDQARIALIYMAAQFLVAMFLNRILKLSLGRPRPFMEFLDPVLWQPLSLDNHYESMASGHTTDALCRPGGLEPLLHLPLAQGRRPVGGLSGGPEPGRPVRALPLRRGGRRGPGLSGRLPSGLGLAPGRQPSLAEAFLRPGRGGPGPDPGPGLGDLEPFETGRLDPDLRPHRDPGPAHPPGPLPGPVHNPDKGGVVPPGDQVRNLRRYGPGKTGAGPSSPAAVRPKAPTASTPGPLSGRCSKPGSWRTTWSGAGSWGR